MGKIVADPLFSGIMYGMEAAYPLVRNPSALRQRRFDVLVIGGGIYGAWTAYDAAQRGLSVALIERDDWAAGTSSASSKLIHGGLRYFEQFEFPLVRRALTERRILAQLAPHLVQPLRFVVPVYRRARVGRFRLGAGLTLYDWLAGGDQPTGRHRYISRKGLARRYPFLDAQHLRGGFSYGDCQEDDARMTLTVVAAAQASGAVCANRIEALTLEEGCNAQVNDRVRRERFRIDARTVVVAAGPWTGAFLAGAGITPPPIKLVRGAHLMLPAVPGCSDAFLLTAPQDGRVFFIIPWYGRSLVGTTESEVSRPGEGTVTEVEIRYLLDAVDARLPDLGWKPADVIAGFSGVRTLQANAARTLSAVTREFTVSEPRPGLLVPLGGKFTTARSDASAIVDRLHACLGRAPGISRTATTPLPGAPAMPFQSWLNQTRNAPELADLDEAVAISLLLRYGTRVARVQELIRETPSLARRLHPAAPFIAAEVELARRDEMAMSDEDVLRRRVPLRLVVPVPHGS